MRQMMPTPTGLNFRKGSKKTITWICLRLVMLTLALLIVCGQSANAQSMKKESRLLSIAKFSTGVLTAYALHEVGHLAAARLTNTDIEFGVGRYNQPIGFTENAENDTSGVLLHSAGLLTQALVSEVILQSDSIDKNDTLVRGMMFWNIINPIVYALDYWFLRRTNQESDTSYQGDIEGIENYSDETTANIFAGAMALVTAYQGYRYVQTQTWAPDWTKNDMVQLSLRPAGSRGAMLNLHFRF